MEYNQPIVEKGDKDGIQANWQKLLQATSLTKNQSEKPLLTDNKVHFTGSYWRRQKKQNNQNNEGIIENKMKALNISDNKSAQLASSTSNANKKETRADKRIIITKFIAMDCEMVGVGYNGVDHMLARVSLVNKFGHCIYDKFVKAQERVVDYRTHVSGVRKEDMLNGEDFTVVQKEVSKILKGRILVGHSLRCDLGVLYLNHPKNRIRDISKYKPFRQITQGSTPSLKLLAKTILGIDIQHGEHNSVEDARAAMHLYCTVANSWEKVPREIW